ncbi:DUF378 domain-containing protein [Candidatus Daviesbacteria bacterium]|nr:DUF378 domain-containing protein [Candidatus Daviesbacteria bacterium]
MKTLHMLAFTLVIVGALNWGLVALWDFNLVANLVGTWPGVEKLVYIAVGLSALYLILTHKNDCKTCSAM